MMRILHLPGESVRGYSEDDIRDIFSYFEPDITVTTGMRDFQRKMIEESLSYEAIDLDLVRGFNKRVFGDEDLLVLRDQSELSEVSLNSDRRTIVMTDLVKENMDPTSFDFQLTGTSMIDSLQEEKGEFQLLSTEIEAGKKPICRGKTVHGFGLSDEMGDVKIPCVWSGDRPHIETLEAGKVGLSAVTGLGRKFSSLLKRSGIVSREELCSCEPSDLLNYEGIGPYRSTKWISSAKAMEDQEVYQIHDNDLEGKHRIFIDIETDSLNPSIIWHIGVFDDKEDEYKFFLERDPDRKAKIIDEFMDYLEERGGQDTVLLAWYGHKFDYQHLGSFIAEYTQEKKSLWDSIEKIDFMRWVDRHAALPCRCSKLESVAMRVGYDPELLGLDGAEVGRMYSEYMVNEEKEINWDELKLYGREDVMAMKYIYDRIDSAPMLYDLGKIKKEYIR